MLRAQLHLAMRLTLLLTLLILASACVSRDGANLVRQSQENGEQISLSVFHGDEIIVPSNVRAASTFVGRLNGNRNRHRVEVYTGNSSIATMDEVKQIPPWSCMDSKPFPAVLSFKARFLSPPDPPPGIDLFVSVKQVAPNHYYVDLYQGKLASGFEVARWDVGIPSKASPYCMSPDDP